MRRYIYILMCIVSMTTMQSCFNDNLDVEMPEAKGDYISLSISSLGLETRSQIPSNALEESVSHLDVVIFNEAGDRNVYSERINVTEPAATVKLNMRRCDYLVEGDKYFVYVIANSTLPATDFSPSSLNTIDELRYDLEQRDERIHITGSATDNAPSRFLMDGVAFLNPNGDASEPSTPTAVVLYDGKDSESTRLEVVLRRAAAKVVVRLHKGDNVEFFRNEHIGYYLRNMPYSTSLVPAADPNEKPHPELRTPDKTTGKYFSWSENVIEVTAYLYSHSWDVNDFFEKGTSLIVNIPLRYAGVEYENSYYQIALRPSDMLYFERNHHYTVTGTINAPGAEEVSEPIDVEDLRYSVREWDEVIVDVNGENAPKYLTINRDILHMHNEVKDSLTLEYVSSSGISISVFDAYYINKFGIKTGIQTAGINATTKGGMSGNIVVTSPLPTNNTIRYFGLAIVNEDGLKDTVYVQQYPLIYITNQQGWYSYRDDFKNTDSRPTTYEYKGNGIVNVSLSRTNHGTNYRPVYEYGYTYGTSSNSGFWRSKVATPLDNGMSNINYYSWNNVSGNTPATSSAERESNARMYHIRVTSTSSNYKVGRPRMTADGYTDSGDDNAELVSPSFMIASRLGFVDISSGNIGWADSDSLKVELYRNHCSNYVEVYKDENGQTVELRDWRLPTEAELKIIMDLQGTGNNAEAIDYLLNATYYVAAGGPVYNDKSEGWGTTVAGRCVRDAFEKR